MCGLQALCDEERTPRAWEAPKQSWPREGADAANGPGSSDEGAAAATDGASSGRSLANLCRFMIPVREPLRSIAA